MLHGERIKENTMLSRSRSLDCLEEEDRLEEEGRPEEDRLEEDRLEGPVGPVEDHLVMVTKTKLYHQTTSMCLMLTGSCMNLRWFQEAQKENESLLAKTPAL